MPFFCLVLGRAPSGARSGHDPVTSEEYGRCLIFGRLYSPATGLTVESLRGRSRASFRISLSAAVTCESCRSCASRISLSYCWVRSISRLVADRASSLCDSARATLPRSVIASSFAAAVASSARDARACSSSKRTRAVFARPLLKLGFDAQIDVGTNLRICNQLRNECA